MAKQLKTMAKEAAIDRVTTVVNEAWTEFYKAAEEAYDNHKAANKDPENFKYSASMSLTIEGDIKGHELDIGASASWTVKDGVNPPSKKVSDQPELPLA